MFIPIKNRIATLVKLLEHPKDRVELQKIIFILQNEGIDFDMMYSYNVYGPFSEDLQIEIDILVQQEVLSVKENKYSIHDSCKNSANDESVKKQSTLIETLKGLDREKLELISSMYFFNNLDYTKDMIKDKICRLKSSIVKDSSYLYDDAWNVYQSIIQTKIEPSLTVANAEAV